MDDDGVRRLLRSVDRVLIARGRRLEDRPARDVALADLKGPTGKYRAPMLAAGDRLLVGFHEEALDALLAEA